MRKRAVREVFGEGESRSLFSGFVWIEVLSSKVCGGGEISILSALVEYSSYDGKEKWGFCSNDFVRAFSVHRPLDCCNSVVDDKDH